MATKKPENVSGQVFTMPLGEKSWITVRRRPTHVELVELHIVFVEGTRAAGCPKLDVAEMAIKADAAASVFASYVALAKDWVKITEDLSSDAPAGLAVNVPSLEETTTFLIRRSPPGHGELVEADKRARGRARRQRIDDDFLAQVAEYRAEHSASETADKYSTSVRNVFRWDRLARERGLAE